ncbi:MAG: YggS family pyridoxal phosphate-dependent enzyme [Clostridiales Family XIII bacterium]|jgi:pyridoxal phosphate enzyme (YggS family)|nr:YggS family pyridoxal phosphate-dependent enzyme [Clostridiales Family XIII bacterium]
MDNHGHIVNNVAEVRGRIAAAAARAGRNPDDITLVAVTKTRTPEEMAAAVEAGCVDLGENRVQEYLEKREKTQHLAENSQKFQKNLNIRWHLIGHLQRNKVKYIADGVSLIHSVDSFRLAEEIETRAAALERRIEVLLQLNPAGETQKSGVAPQEAEALALEIAGSLPHVAVTGLMAVVPIAEDPEEVRGLFREVRALYDALRERHTNVPDGALPEFRRLSMGMTHDFEVAVEEGATIVRVGTGIFGARV